MIYIVIFFFFGLLSTAYLTLHERHILALVQHRLGPNKTFFIGVLQPFRDAFKLFQKEVIIPVRSDIVYYLVSPLVIFFLWFLYWLLSISRYSFIRISNGGLLFLCLVGSNVYTLFFIGYSRKSKYSYLGALRSTAQSLTFEVRFFFLVLSYLYVSKRLGFRLGSSLLYMPIAYL